MPSLVEKRAAIDSDKDIKSANHVAAPITSNMRLFITAIALTLLSAVVSATPVPQGGCGKEKPWESQ
jgi:hypothetical protein